tara:strand:+ start:810 stop:1148 length:339 start_codon:yes stop_codon:yes gene_type:complete
MAYKKNFRNRKRPVFSNKDPLYKDLFERKKIKNFNQYSSAVITNIRNIDGVNNVKHVWKTGDRYYKLAAKFYNRPELWWVIALYNKKPTEGHLKKGDIVLVPMPLELILYYL